MQEEEKFDTTDFMNKSVESLFLGIQETYSEAQQRALEENKSFQKTDYFRMDKFGVYNLRILPLAPNPDGTAERKTYEYPVHQMLMELEKPTTGGKQQFMYVTVPRATDAGYSVDLIDTYRKAAVNEAKDRGDEKLSEKIGGGTFGGGLKYTYGHAMYIHDLNEKGKGIQLLTLSHSQFKDLDDRKFKLWQKKLVKNPNYPCPISSVYNAYPVEIEKKKNGQKTEYLISIDNESDNVGMTIEELNALMAAPRIPEIIYRYSRYQFEATIEFLKQCDKKYEMGIMESDEMKEVIETLGSELPKEDTSSFSFDKRTKDSKDNSSGGISVDDLFNRFDDLQEQGLNDKTEEGQELRGLIRAFIEQEKLPVRVTRSTTNSDLLDQIEAAIEERSNEEEQQEPEKEEEEEKTSKDTAPEEPASRTRRRRS
jgi:hypothetical protein